MKRRWWKLVSPVAVALAVIIGTSIMHTIEEPDKSDPAYLSPGFAGTDEGIGAVGLAERLRARGIAVERETRTSDALLAAYRGDATLFLPTPGLMHWRYLEMLALMPSTTRVVMVEPSQTDLRSARVPLALYDTEWATIAPEPFGTGEECPIRGAEKARTAAVTRSRYEGASAQRCYQDGLVRANLGTAEVVVVGSGDVFRNDRLLEHDNATLAVGLLSQKPKLIWLDLHAPEAGPKVDQNANPAGEPMPPSLQPGNGPGEDSGGNEGTGMRTPPPGVAAPEQNDSGESPPSPWEVFPPSLWAMLVGTLIGLLLLALWRARRLGRPVGEPLAIAVRGSETLYGRARLYRRSRATDGSLEIMRRTLRPKIAAEAGLPPGADAADIADAVIARLGEQALPFRAPASPRMHRLRRADILDALSGPPAGSERDMLFLVRILEYVHTELRARTAPRQPQHHEGDQP